MNPNRKSSGEEEKAKNERINLNDPDRKEESNAIKEHSDKSIKDIDQNLDEQMGGTDSTVTSRPNNI
jgi:hypothetical protein